LIQASEARQNKRIDELKDDMKEIKADIKALLLAQGGQPPEITVAAGADVTGGRMRCSPSWPVQRQSIPSR